MGRETNNQCRMHCTQPVHRLSHDFKGMHYTDT